MADLDYHYADDDGETATLVERDEGPARRTASEALAELALDAALGPAARRAVRRPGVAVVVTCPDASWVQPVKLACARMGWSGVYARTGASRLEDQPEKGNAEVREKLAAGLRVLGVSQDPACYLPSALVLGADLVVEIPPPSPELVKRVVAAASGRTPRSAPASCAGLSYDEIAAQVRLNAPPRDALRRLAAAASAKVAAEPAVRDAPPFETLVGLGDYHRWGLDLIRSVDAYRAGEITLSDVAGRACVVAGAPGLGKTSSLRSLAASASLTLVETSVARWFGSSSGHLGDVVRAMNAAFAAALARAPSLLVIDEIEAMPARDQLSPDEASWWTTACTGLLLKISETLAHPRALVFVAGATNHPHMLDPALVRPGRLDRTFHLVGPTPDELVAIVRQHLRSELADADLGILGTLGAGSTGAAAAGWVADARAKARLARRATTLADLVDAVAPPDRRTPEAVWRTAVHEAGHAAVVEALGGRVESVSVVARPGESGRTTRAGEGADLETRAGIEAEVTCYLAGRAAETVLVGDQGAGGGGGPDSDLARATTLLGRLHGSLGLGTRLRYLGSDGEVLALMRLDRSLADAVEVDLVRLMADAVALIESSRDAVQRVARALVARRVLDGAAVRDLLADRPPLVH